MKVKGCIALCLLPLLVGCSGLYMAEGLQDGQVIDIIVVGDPDTLLNVCKGRMACAEVAEESCRIYLPEGATDQMIVHEISHCTGRVDQPPVGNGWR